MNVYHVYANGRGDNLDPWNDLADIIAKKAAGGFISNCGPFKKADTDDNADEGVSHIAHDKERTKTILMHATA